MEKHLAAFFLILTVPAAIILGYYFGYRQASAADSIVTSIRN